MFRGYSIGEYRSIGIKNHFNKNTYFATINSIDEDMVTSGIYEQYCKINIKLIDIYLNKVL